MGVAEVAACVVKLAASSVHFHWWMELGTACRFLAR